MTLLEAAQQTVRLIDLFDRSCAELEYTDTGECWALLDDIRAKMKLAIEDTNRANNHCADYPNERTEL